MMETNPVKNLTRYKWGEALLKEAVERAQDKSIFYRCALELEGPFPGFDDFEDEVFVVNSFSLEDEKRYFIHTEWDATLLWWSMYSSEPDMRAHKNAISAGSFHPSECEDEDFGWWWFLALGFWINPHTGQMELPEDVTEVDENSLRFYLAEEIILPPGITCIREYAFEHHPAKRIILPDTLLTIEDYAFEESLVEEIDIPESIKELGEYAFDNCKHLRRISIPDSLDFVSFCGCRSLKELTVPFATKVFDGGGTFLDSLEKIKLHKDVRSIADSAFVGLPSLKIIELDPDNPYFTISGGCLFNKEMTHLYRCFDGEKFTSMPESTESISPYAFYCCSQLYQIRLQSVSKIPNCSFAKCQHLYSVEMPASVKFIERESFTECSELTEIDFPDTLENIGRVAFDQCRSLKSITLPSSVRQIEYGAFRFCDSLTEIRIKGNLKLIPEYAFFCCKSLDKIEFGSGVQIIGQYAFARCSNLKSVSLPEGVHTIMRSAFSECNSLETVQIPSSLKTLQIVAFSECTGIRYLRMDCPEPPDCFLNVGCPFPHSIFETCLLSVPKVSLLKYKMHPVFGKFKNIQTNIP